MEKKSMSCFSRKVLGIGFSAVLLLMLSVVFFVFPSSASADTISLSPDGTNNDEIKINNAINEVSAASSSTNPGTVHLNPGTYKILNQIVVKKNVTLEGRDSTTIISAQPGINSAHIPFYGVIKVFGDNTGVKDIDINGNMDKVGLGGGAGWLVGINFWGNLDYNNVTIRNINIYNMPDDGIAGASNNTIIDNIHVSNIGHAAIRIGGGSGRTKGYKVSNIKADTKLGNAGIRLSSISNVYINNVDITNPLNFALEISTTDGTNEIVDSVTIENFRYIVGSRAGFNVINIFNSFTTLNQIKNITFKNIIINMKNTGNVYPAGTKASIYIQNATNITFDNLTVYDAYGNTIHAQNLTGQNSNITVKNSILEKGSGYGIYGSNNITWNIHHNSIRNQTSGSYGGSAVVGNAGSGNIYDKDPLFANTVNNDYHLKSPFGRWNGTTFVTTDPVISPCIGTGDPTSDNTKSPCGGTIEMGAYGNTTEASKSRAGCNNTAVVRMSLEPRALSGVKLTVKGSLLKIDGLSEGASGTIFDVRGAIVSKISRTNADDASVSMRLFSAGVYFVKFNDRGKDPTGKVYPVFMR